MEAKGIARDAHQKFPIRFDFSEKDGSAFFIGCRIEAKEDIGGGKTIDKKMDIRAFGDVATELAHVTDGMEIHIKGSYGLQKSTKDGNWYPILNVDEVVSA